jgi:translation initiation factor IF-3
MSDCLTYGEVDRISKRRYSSDTRVKYRLNHQIRAPHVRLIDADGNHVGIVPLSEALRTANAKDMDLVEVSPTAEPPVVRVMDYGKFMYQQAKREREARKAQKQIEVKEIRFRPKTTDHHRGIKVEQARGWLEDGMKVKVRIRFRGREITYPEIARDQLEEIAEQLSDVAVVEQQPNLEGRTMLMILAPAKKSGAKKK